MSGARTFRGKRPVSDMDAERRAEEIAKELWDVEIDLEEEREASLERRQLEQDRAMAERIAKELWGRSGGAKDRIRMVNDAIARRPVERYSSERIRRIHELVVDALERRDREQKELRSRKPKPRRKKPVSVEETKLSDIPNIHGPSAMRIMESGVRTVGELVKLTKAEVFELPYMGPGTFNCVMSYLRVHGLELAEEAADVGDGQDEREGEREDDDEGEEGGGPEEDPRVLRIEDGGRAHEGDDVGGLPQHDELHLHGPWGTFCMVRDAEGEEAVQVDFHGRVSAEAADRLAALLLHYKYDIHVDASLSGQGRRRPS